MTDILRPQRPLGATGVRVPLICYGSAGLGKPDVTGEHAVRCLNHAIDRGITYLDTSPDYGSEAHIGEVMKTRRDEVFLATKVNNRSRAGVLRELHDSLRRLKTDMIDLVQIHAVSAWADLEQALAPDGACAALEQARSEGLIRFIGITGHARPDLLAQALDRYRFDTVLAAMGICDRLITYPEGSLVPAANRHHTGLVAMKVFGHGAVEQRHAALRYTLGLPGVAAANIGLNTIEQIDEIVELTGDLPPVSEDELNRLAEQVRPLIERDAAGAHEAHTQLFWLHDTNVMGWRRDDEPGLVQY